MLSANSSATLLEPQSPPLGSNLAELFEQYRPRSWSDVIGQDAAIAKLKTIARRGLCGRAYWLSGASGTGKTTIAKLLAAEVADDWTIDEVDAELLTPKLIDELERGYQCRAIGKGGRVIIVNEAHGLKQAAVRQLLTTLERLPAHVMWIFTTTADGQERFEGGDDAAPFLSRCAVIALSQRDLCKPFAERLLAIARAEELDGGCTLADCEKLLKAHRNNFRRALGDIQLGKLLA